jgi:hypothetical protein
MADTGVQVFVGPANQLELGTVSTGPASVELETVSDRLQRLNISIPSPTQELVDAADGAQVAAEAAAIDAEDAKTAAAASASSAASAVGQAASSATAAAGSLTAATTAQGAATAAAAAAAAAAAPTDAQLNAIVTAKLLPSNLALDTDGVPYINPGSNSVFVYADTDGRPYFVS